MYQHLHDRDLVDNTVEQTDNLKREVSALEAQLPSEESRRKVEEAVREETESVWRHKLSVISEENERLNDLVLFLQEVIQDECVSPLSVWRCGCSKRSVHQFEPFFAGVRWKLNITEKSGARENEPNDSCISPISSPR